ncbi:helix-turn-helix transcriptional regulator [Acinetobacter schindleri]|uniref:helix-turn-helix transcriptional regulator n=1 Tax=Acinetobacter schindleri TaxID=108981 RepID=UPI002DB81BA0|nr:helix-turn-helix transcriptional regulator [Acinetobacter schindleri]MEB5928399.1 helix-turn-helix domain-containing protein [Acinetobacter schindleri]
MASRAEIGLKIREARRKLDYTQQMMAKKSGVNKSTISEIENGRFTGSFDIFERLIDAVGLQFEVMPKKRNLPNWNDIDTLFSEED